MHLMFTLDAHGKRQYTLKKVTDGEVTKSAHPARFSPDDKYSRHRVTLKKRYGLLITQQKDKKVLGHAGKGERRLVAWIRLVDGRASSAGADGSFLAETDKTSHPQSTAEKPSLEEVPSDPSPDGNTVEDILFDVLYAPGLAFYQRVQSIMARVSNIDPWHRARGTVSDETEVMAVAANITNDLRTLEAQRPALMDHAVTGALTEQHIAHDIAAAITRSYRVYWANYQAGHIHLHRVAYKHLPPTVEVLDARATIKRTARLLEQTGEQLPVNFIWPLLMASCEEEDLAERAWMIQ
ncbi:hypothetical protein B0A54_01513 [Friedmanniomyces endolithicus]|uniref:H/ACA ribonucleoprotein complex subunit NOP10 n=1 Tax=Friedmanniomyces endolithicus TaxID=329885 RepID=A0A4U0VGZ8_9PEZI|nr:hypothetical protein B0A54_01513 [Friedmanniomyces endolithicus]